MTFLQYCQYELAHRLWCDSAEREFLWLWTVPPRRDGVPARPVRSVSILEVVAFLEAVGEAQHADAARAVYGRYAATRAAVA